jgi:hypothetical protein
MLRSDNLSNPWLCQGNVAAPLLLLVPVSCVDFSLGIVLAGPPALVCK